MPDEARATSKEGSRGPEADGQPVADAQIPADASSAGPLPAREGAPAGVASAAIVGGFLALVVCLVLLGTIADAIRLKELFVLDATASPFLHGLASPWLDAVMNAATFVGSSGVLLPAFVLVTAFLLAQRRWGSALFLTVASVGSILLNELMKLYFQRPRPQLPWSHVQPDYSFPSGHTMNSLAFLMAVAIVVWSLRGRRAGILAVVGASAIVLLVGVSRIYLGYHYLTDVVGGLLAATVWLLIVLGAFRIRPLGSLWGRSHRESATGGRRSQPLG